MAKKKVPKIQLGRVVSTRVPDELFDRITEKADKYGFSNSTLVRIVLEQFLNKLSVTIQEAK